MSVSSVSSRESSEQNGEFPECYQNGVDEDYLSGFRAIAEASTVNDINAEQWENLTKALSRIDIKFSLPIEQKNKLVYFLSQLYAAGEDSVQLADTVLSSLLRSPIFYDGLPDGIDHLLLESGSIDFMNTFLTNFGDASESSLVQLLKFLLKQKVKPSKAGNHPREIILKRIVEYPYTGDWLCSQLKALNDKESVAFFKWLSSQLARSLVSYERNENVSKVADLLKIIGHLIDAKFSSLARDVEIIPEVNECAVILDILFSMLKLVRLSQIQQDPRNEDYGVQTSYYIQKGWLR